MSTSPKNVVIIAGIVSILLIFAHFLMDRRSIRKGREKEKRAKAERQRRAKLKGKIIKIGNVTEDVPHSWEIDVSNGACEREYSEDGKEVKWGGYTIEELKKISNCKWVSELCEGLEKELSKTGRV